MPQSRRRRDGRRPASHGGAAQAAPPGGSPGVLYVPSPFPIQATPTRLGHLKERCPGPPPVFLPTPTNLFRPPSPQSALDLEQPEQKSRVQQDRQKKIAKGRRLLAAWRRKRDLQALDISSAFAQVVDRQYTVPPGQPDTSLTQAECALLNAAMQPKGLDWKTGAALRASVANFLKALPEFAPGSSGPGDRT